VLAGCAPHPHATSWPARYVMDSAAPTPIEAFADPEPGISETLARDRAGRIADVRYGLSWSVPSDCRAPIAGRESIAFTLGDASEPLVIDFNPAGGAALQGFDVNGQEIEPRRVNGHIVVPARVLRPGGNVVTCRFDVGDAPLNRHDEFFYTLLVPARAHEAFPCFDQPSLKARWTLELEVPHGWVAFSNGAEATCDMRGGRPRFTFTETPPISTYLFAVAAGGFIIDRVERDGRTFRMFHRETDARAFARNRDAIADAHAASLDWLERYTGMPCPFEKFDCLLVPAFQFGGMEHPGAIFYNASQLILGASASESQRLDRAALIAHETAHLWFGDLVTMEWFDDVWLKEVFANLMAGKIVARLYPDMNHDLRFLHAHYPAAYEVDRTDGANAIRQPLSNLDEAGSLYGPIVYHKSPIVMRQLETLIGPDAFRAGVREYLRRYAFGHASWTDLVKIFDARAAGDLAAWSRAWVEEAGRPVIQTKVAAEDGVVARLALVDSSPPDRRCTQTLSVALVYPDRVQLIPVQMDRDVVEIETARGLAAPSAILPNGAGLGYGEFHLDRDSLEWLLVELPQVRDPLTRGAAWVTLWDAMLAGEAGPGRLVDLALRALPHETDALNIHRVLVYLVQAYWRFTAPRRRTAIAARVERTLIDLLHQSPTITLKAAYFEALRTVALTPSTLGWLTSVWRREQQVPSLVLAEEDEVLLAQELAVRTRPGWDTLLAQLERTQNPDRRARLEFVAAALSSDRAVRDGFFASLSEASHRAHEAWVLEGMRYLHHPLRSAQSIAYIAPSLELLLEIQRTGDIFFPQRWVNATLGGHQTAEAASEVRAFLGRLPSGYPDRLRRVVLSAADPLFRASRMIAG
jgi:aminopeptidase N